MNTCEWIPNDIKYSPQNGLLNGRESSRNMMIWAQGAVSLMNRQQFKNTKSNNSGQKTM
jgi:hypothetical protein